MRCGGLALLLLALAGPGSGGPSGPGGQGGQRGGGGGGCPPADRAVEHRGAPDNSSLDGGCAACRLRSEVRQMSLAAIREHVLARLGFAHAPNTTGRVLPTAPKDMMLMFERGRQQELEMQADQPHKYSYHEDEDDFHARTEKVIAFPRKYRFHALHLTRPCRCNFSLFGSLHLLVSSTARVGIGAISGTISLLSNYLI